tara:strand:- start:597 stop:737 length:141 start_codon:yes stop_codon:yes gene_type:complete
VKESQELFTAEDAEIKEGAWGVGSRAGWLKLLGDSPRQPKREKATA